MSSVPAFSQRYILHRSKYIFSHLEQITAYNIIIWCGNMPVHHNNIESPKILSYSSVQDGHIVSGSLSIHCVFFKNQKYLFVSVCLKGAFISLIALPTCMYHVHVAHNFFPKLEISKTVMYPESSCLIGKLRHYLLYSEPNTTAVYSLLRTVVFSCVPRAGACKERRVAAGQTYNTYTCSKRSLVPTRWSHMDGMLIGMSHR